MPQKTFSFLVFVILLTTLVFPATLYSAERIVNVDVEGLSRVDEPTTRGFIKSVEGTAYSSDTIKGDIQRLYKTGLFSDVSVDRQNIAGGVKIVFKVIEAGIVKKVTFKGNKKVKDKDLTAASLIHDDTAIDQKRISDSIDAIKKVYLDKGYQLADVTYELVPVDTVNKLYELVFNVRENAGIKIKRINFVGNKDFKDKKLSGQMKTRVKGMLSFVSSSGKYKSEMLDRDVAALTYFYLNNGYVNVKIGEPQVSLTRNRQALYVTIPVYEGLQYKVGLIDMQGDVITTKEELLSNNKLKVGKVYSRQLQDDDMQRLATLYGDQAYAYANLYPKIITHDESKTADVIYYIEKGMKVYVDRIIFKGNNITRDKVLRREMALKESAPFNKTFLDLSEKRLNQLGYFETVNFSMPKGRRENMVDLVVEVKEKPTGTFSIGAGFSSLESFIFTGSVQKENFFGMGLKGGASVNISKKRQEFTFNMTDRYFMDTNWILSTQLYRYSSSLNRDFDQESFGGSVSFGREIFEDLDVSVGYNLENVKVRNFSALVPAFFQNRASGLTSSATSTVAYDTRDNRLFASKGMYHAATVEYAGAGIGGDNDFWKFSAESRIFFSPIKKTVFKARGMFSYVNSLNSNSVPLFERYFLGGINTLRGFDLNSVGPELRIPASAAGGDTRFVYGGNRMLLFNAEYELPIYDPAGFKGVLFVDAGQAFGETESIDIMRLRANYGFGFRWNSPFGPLRFEWGFPFSRKSGESRQVFNFTIGQSF